MFTDLLHEQKISTFAIAALCCPTEARVDPELRSDGWQLNMLTKLTIDMNISEAYIIAYSNLVSSSYPISEVDLFERKNVSKPFMSMLAKVDLRNAKLYIRMKIFLLVNNLYNANARVLLRNLKSLLRMGTEEFLAVEEMLTGAVL